MNFQKAEFLTSYGRFPQIPPSTKLEFAFAGRSNVGKSSLINKILNRKSLARVSSMPGKTATINFYAVDEVYLVDLPGYGYAKVSQSEKQRWSELIEGYLLSDREISLIFQLIDFRHAPTENDLHMINFLIDHEIPFVIILTKADKLSVRQRETQKEIIQKSFSFMENITMIEFSAETGEGVDKLREIIEEAVQENFNIS